MNACIPIFRNAAAAALFARRWPVRAASLAPAAAQPAAAQSGQLDQAVAALRGIATMQADFTQTDRNGQRVNGMLTLKRPGRIRFQYAPGVPMLIVSDGKALTLIDYEVRQVQRWPIGNSPLGALLDPNRDVSRFGTLQPTGDPDVVSVEVRDRAASRVRRDHADLRAQGFGARRTRAGELGGARFAEQADDDSARQSPVRRRRFRQRLSVERPPPPGSSMTGNGLPRSVPAMRQAATPKCAVFTWQKAKSH